jgi:5'-methylthioadenosine phosphorylase
MEGPAFSTRAESRLHRSWGADVIGMTALPEAKLAREAEICYAVIACATDYDSWHETKEVVSVDAIFRILRKNIELSKRIIELAVTKLGVQRECGCQGALEHAIVTAPALIPAERKRDLAPIIGRYLR